MRIELTQQSGLEVDRLSAADMTPAMAAQYLSASIHIRGFWEMLRRYAPVGICSASPLPWDWTRNRPPACWAYAQTTASTTATAGN